MMTRSYNHVCLKVGVFVGYGEPKHRTQNTTSFLFQFDSFRLSCRSLQRNSLSEFMNTWQDDSKKGGRICVFL